MIDVAQVTDKLQRLKRHKAAAALAAAEAAAARKSGAVLPAAGRSSSGGGSGNDELWIVDPKTGLPQAVPASRLRERVRTCCASRNSSADL